MYVTLYSAVVGIHNIHMWLESFKNIFMGVPVVGKHYVDCFLYNIPIHIYTYLPTYNILFCLKYTIQNIIIYKSFLLMCIPIYYYIYRIYTLICKITCIFVYLGIYKYIYERVVYPREFGRKMCICRTYRYRFVYIYLRGNDVCNYNTALAAPAAVYT